MIDININNYEEYFLDFIEGNLNSVDEEILMSFLDQHPDLKQELDLFEESIVVEENILFDQKSGLKKESILSGLANSNFDELCIARLENDLTFSQQKYFDDSLNEDENKQKEYKLYKLTKIEADQSVTFDNKNLLKKKTRTPVFTRNLTIISAAASVAILMALYIFLPKLNENTHMPMADGGVVDSNKIEKVDEVQEAIVKSESIIEETTKMAKLPERQIAIRNKVNTDLEKVIISESVVREKEEIEELKPIEVKYKFNLADANMDIKYIVTNTIHTGPGNDDYISFKTYMASTINKRVLKKEDKKRIEFFDIAQAGINGINKLTGSKMKLERVYDKEGNPDRTEFNSRLIAFSAPVKKD